MPVQVRPAVPEAASGDNRPFWAIFYAKKTARRKALPRLFIAFQASCFCGLYCSPFPPFSFAFIKNTRIAKPPANAPMGAAEDTFAAPSRNAISIPSSAPIAAEAATTVAKNTTMINAIPILRMIKSLPKRDALHSRPRATFAL